MKTGSFGTLTFSVSAERVLTPTETARDYGARWHEHAIVGRKPRREFLGDGLKSYKMPVRLDASLGINPAAELKKLDAMVAAGGAYPLFLGTEYKGRFTLDGISDTTQATFADGTPMVIVVQLNLTEYV